MNPGLDICVVSYNTPEYLDGFLQSVQDFPADRQAVYLRVNGLTDLDSDVISRHNHSVDHVEFGENLGYSLSVNRLASYGQNDIIGIFNADVSVDTDALQACCDALRDNPDWGVLGPRSLDSSGKITHAGIFGTNTAPKHRGWKSRDSQTYRDVQEAVTVSGSAYFIKRTVWEELALCPLYREACGGIYDDPERSSPFGAFLPTDHYYEETYCSYHARSHGYKVVYYGPEYVIHEWHKSSKVGDPLTDGKMKKSQGEFRAACDLHGIERD